MTSATATQTLVHRMLAQRHRMLSAWIANWDGGASYRQVLSHGRRFRFASPYWYMTTGDPDAIGLNDPPVAADVRASWTTALHDRGIEVIPTVGSRWNPDTAQLVFTDPTLRTQHVDALVDLVGDNGYDGIDLDYEGFTRPGSDTQAHIIRHAYAAFVGQLCTRLHAAGKQCMVTLGPVTADGPRNVLDYRAIGRAADLVRLMCYDLHGPWSRPGPISTTAWTRQVLRFAVSRVPRSKIELDVPTYGYQWPAQAGVDDSLTWQQVQGLIRLHRGSGTLGYSKSLGEAWFRWRADGQLHTVWYENARSLAPKVALANRFRIHSVGFWMLGAQDPKDWTTLLGLRIS
jgi:spore germination protein YaaH